MLLMVEVAVNQAGAALRCSLLSLTLAACASPEYADFLSVNAHDIAADPAAECLAVQSEIAFSPVAPNVMWLVDMSGSMEGERWELMQSAVGQGLPLEANVGLSVVPADGFCGAGEPVVHIGSGDASTAVADALLFLEPTGATPMAAAVDALAALPELQDPTRDNVVLMLTDGIESCEGDAMAAVERLVGQPVPVQLRVMALGTYEHTDVVLQGLVDAASTTTPGGVLYKADNVEAILAGLARAQRSCRFAVGDRVTEVEVAGRRVELCHSDDCEEGVAIDDSTGDVVLLGRTCDAYYQDPCGRIDLGP